MKRAVVVGVALMALTAFLPAAAGEDDPPDLPAELKVAKGGVGLGVIESTGRATIGAVVKTANDSITIKPTGPAQQNVCVENIIDMRIYFDDEHKAQFAAMPEDQQLLEQGKYLISKKMNRLAREPLAQHLKKYPDSADKVKEAWTAAKEPLPPELGGAAPTKKIGGPDGPKYVKPTLVQVRESLAKAKEYGAIMKVIAPATRRLDTEHFIIYTSRPASHDATLKELCEKVYAENCKVYKIRPEENIWIGKMPVYAFKGLDDFNKFIQQALDGMPGLSTHQFHKGNIRVIALGNSPSSDKPDDGAVHATWTITEQFNQRSFNDKDISPRWLRDGLRDTVISNTTQDVSGMKYINEFNKALKEGKLLPSYLSDFVKEYPPGSDAALVVGGWHSMIRYLIGLDNNKFLRTIELVKNGKSDEEALKTAFGKDRDTLLKEWLSKVR